MLTIGILISGRGSNMAAILDAIRDKRLPVRLAVVISNNPEAAGLKTAEAAGVPTRVISPKSFGDKHSYEAEILSELESFFVELLVLAGYMRLLGATLIDAYRNRILNIHPSLLPEFKGLNAQKQALEAGVSEAGCTVHFVDESLDGGPIIAQRKVPVLPDDTEESLSARILREEHQVYSEVIGLYAEKRLQIQDGTVTILPSH